MTYMALCDGPCSSFAGTTAKWFKIDEAGQKPGLKTWYQQDLSTASLILFAEFHDLTSRRSGGKDFLRDCP